jgi:hypothetical protein
MLVGHRPTCLCVKTELPSLCSSEHKYVLVLQFRETTDTWDTIFMD